MTKSSVAISQRKALREKASELRKQAAELDKEADKIKVEVVKPRKTKAQLEQELASERERRIDSENKNIILERQLNPPDMSYFGLGDGPT